MSAPAMIYPVYGFSRPYNVERVAEFFDYGSAADFIRDAERNLYMDEPRYDRRTSGYRFTSPGPVPSYREWLLSLEVSDLGDGRFGVAA